MTMFFADVANVMWMTFCASSGHLHAIAACERLEAVEDSIQALARAVRARRARSGHAARGGARTLIDHGGAASKKMLAPPTAAADVLSTSMRAQSE
jgi:hypothetical protein